MSGEDKNKGIGTGSGRAASGSGIRPFYRDGTKPSASEHPAVSGKDADSGKKSSKGKRKKSRKPAAAKSSGRSSVKPARSEIESKEKSGNKKPSRGYKTAVAALLLIIAIGAAFYGIFRICLVSRINVVGCERSTPTQIINAAGLYTGKCILAYDTKAIKKSLESDPYLNILSVKRVYPNEIRIEIEERNEFAAISTGTGSYCIIDKSGYVLYAGRRDSIEGLIPVYGLGTFGFTTGTYVNSDKSILRPYVMMELLNGIGDRGAEIASVDVSIPASLKITTTDGYTVMLGDSVDIPAKVERMFAALDKARASAPAGSIIYINADSADISIGRPDGTPAPTVAPTEAPTENADNTGSPTEETNGGD